MKLIKIPSDDLISSRVNPLKGRNISSSNFWAMLTQNFKSQVLGII